MSHRLAPVWQTLGAVRSAVKSSRQKSRIQTLKGTGRTVETWSDGPRGVYFVTSDKGLFRCDERGLHQILDIELYGCTIVGPKVYMGFYIGREAIFVEGRSDALFKVGAPFEFRRIFFETTSDTNERIHQITSDGSTVWIARTAAGAGLRYDTRTAKLTNYTLLRDRFGTPVDKDINHINSIVQYGGIVLFTGYNAGSGSLIGLLDGARVTAYAHRNRGVHDIYLTNSGFLFFDTFGRNQPDEGGMPVTESGPLFPEIFSKPPGYVLRGAAQEGDEVLFGSSHKGERKNRFKGNGQLLIFENGALRSVRRLPFAQVYQIITADGGTLEPPTIIPDAASARQMFAQALGEPIYEGEAAISEIEPR